MMDDEEARKISQLTLAITKDELIQRGKSFGVWLKLNKDKGAALRDFQTWSDIPVFPAPCERSLGRTSHSLTIRIPEQFRHDKRSFTLIVANAVTADVRDLYAETVDIGYVAFSNADAIGFFSNAHRADLRPNMDAVWLILCRDNSNLITLAFSLAEYHSQSNWSPKSANFDIKLEADRFFESVPSCEFRKYRRPRFGSSILNLFKQTRTYNTPGHVILATSAFFLIPLLLVLYVGFRLDAQFMLSKLTIVLIFTSFWLGLMLVMIWCVFTEVKERLVEDSESDWIGKYERFKREIQEINDRMQLRESPSPLHISVRGVSPTHLNDKGLDLFQRLQAMIGKFKGHVEQN